MSLKMIVATGLDYEIGIDNKLLWYLPEDMKYFKEQTMNSFVIMGRSTFDSLNSTIGLKDRWNVVITNSPKDYVDLNSVGKNGYRLAFTDINESVLEVAKGKFKSSWIIGGSQIYEEFIDYVDEIHWTLVHKEFPEANKFLSKKTINIMETDFCFESKVKSCSDEKSNTHFTINILKRLK